MLFGKKLCFHDYIIFIDSSILWLRYIVFLDNFFITLVEICYHKRVNKTESHFISQTTIAFHHGEKEGNLADQIKDKIETDI